MIPLMKSLIRRLTVKGIQMKALILALILVGCEYLQPSEKVFSSQPWYFGKGPDATEMHLTIRLSYKADGHCYYRIEAKTTDAKLLDVFSGRGPGHLYINFVDKDSLILYELAPSWNINDKREIGEDNVVWRGRWQIEKAMFNEIDHYEIQTK